MLKTESENVMQVCVARALQNHISRHVCFITYTDRNIVASTPSLKSIRGSLGTPESCDSCDWSDARF